MISQGKQSSTRGWTGRAWYALVKLGFRMLYNELAWSYDGVSWIVSRGQWRAWQYAAVPFLIGESILELAHGPGHMLVALEGAGYHVTGLDLSPAMGRLATRRIKAARNEVGLVRGRSQSLPFASDSFDSVLSTFPTDFLAERETISAAYRVLRPGGRLVIVPQARLTGSGVVTCFIEWLYAITGQRPEAIADARPEFWQVIGDRFRIAGFDLRSELVCLEAGEVTVVIAEKPELSDTSTRSGDLNAQCKDKPFNRK